MARWAGVVRVHYARQKMRGEVSQQLSDAVGSPDPPLESSRRASWGAAGVIEEQTDLIIAHGSDLCQVSAWLDPKRPGLRASSCHLAFRFRHTLPRGCFERVAANQVGGPFRDSEHGRVNVAV